MCSAYCQVLIIHCYYNSMLQCLQHSYDDRDDAADLNHVPCTRYLELCMLFFYEVIFVMITSKWLILWKMSYLSADIPSSESSRRDRCC